MEETELEEGEAQFYHGVDENSTIDPDITLSYIGEKLQDVLGHFQKDFEGGVSAENLGAKFGGYGSFLPTHQGSTFMSHTNSAPEVHKNNPLNASKKLHSEDQRQNSSASRSVSPTARLHDASGKTMGNSLKVDVDLPFRHVNESSLKYRVVKKSVNPSDKRILKVRIKVGFDNLLTQKNAEIYNGLGLVVSPSSSFDESAASGKPLTGNLLDLREGSPISILQTMTSFSGALLLSPLSEDLIHLMEKRKLGGIRQSEFDKLRTEKSGMLANGYLSSRSDQKVTEQKKKKPSEKDSILTELNNRKDSSDQNNSVSALKKENQTDIDTMECDELVSNSLKLSIYTSDVVIGMNGDLTSSGISGKKYLDTGHAQDIYSVENITEKLGLGGGFSESKERKFVSSIAASSLSDVGEAELDHALGESESNVYKGRKALSTELIDPLKELSVQKEGSGSEEGSKSAPEKSSSVDQRKLKGVPIKSSKVAYKSKDKLKVDFSLTSESGKSPHANRLRSNIDSHDRREEKHGDMLNNNFLGDLGFENKNESQSGGMSSTGRPKDRQCMKRGSESEFHKGLEDKCNKVNSENPHSLEVYSTAASHGPPTPGYGPSSEAPNRMAASLNEDWVSCDKCEKRRLLPLGTNPKSLPNKWLCRMLTWLPGMNRCCIPEKETTNALRALYRPSASVQLNQINNSLGTSERVPSVETHNDNEQEPLVNCSDTVTNTKVRSKRESDFDGSKASKRLKKTVQLDDGKGTADLNGASIKAGHGSTSSSNPEIHAPSTSDHRLPPSTIRDYKVSVRKRKGDEDHGSQSHTKPLSCSGRRHQSSSEFVDEMCEIDDRKEKNARASKSRSQHNGHYLSNSRAEDNLKTDRSLGHCGTADSSSYNVSGSLKRKTFSPEAKGSPIEPVSSSRLRFYSADMGTFTGKNLIGKEDFQDSHSLTGVSPKRLLGGADGRGNDQTGVVKKDADICDIPLGQDSQKASEKFSFEQCQKEGKSYADLGHGSLSHLIKLGNDGQDGIKIKEKKHNLQLEHDDKELCKKSDQVEVNGNGKSHSLPPIARIQTETVASLQPVDGSQKGNGGQSAFDNGDALKESRQSKTPQNQNVQPSSSRNPTLKLCKARDAEVPSAVQRDSNSHAANNALKEAKDLKHLADRLKHSGSDESNGLYFQASLKFLHAASLLESGTGSNEKGSKHNDVVQSMNIYSSTAKLCEFCAHEYEKSKDMAAAALAYKCTEAAYMRVVYSSHSRAKSDRNDLQTSLQIFPTGESPSSSASDVDNLNHATTDNLAVLTKVVGSPQVSGNHVITSRSRSGFLRLLNFAQDTTLAMEASRKSRNAYAAASSKLRETVHKDAIDSLKKALDFNFQDVQGLLHLVRVSMEAING